MWRWRTFECTGLIFPWTGVLDGLPGADDYADTLAAARRVIQQVLSYSEQLVGPLDAPKNEPVEEEQ